MASFMTLVTSLIFESDKIIYPKFTQKHFFKLWIWKKCIQSWSLDGEKKNSGGFLQERKSI